jgi:hypothetical protein
VTTIDCAPAALTHADHRLHDVSPHRGGWILRGPEIEFADQGSKWLAVCPQELDLVRHLRRQVRGISWIRVTTENWIGNGTVGTTT